MPTILTVMSPSSHLPLVAVPACRKIDIMPGHWVTEKYLLAVADGARAMPVLVPAMAGVSDSAARLAELMDRVDGLLLTGSPSNVEPHHYEGTPSLEGTAHDPARDATTLPMIRAALAAGLPIFAICRGIQELNVAMGGSLHQLVHELDGRFDHRSDKTVPHEDRYDLRHTVRLRPGGKLAALYEGPFDGPELDVMVNSLHAQAIDRVAPGLTIEAVAEDGTVEAVSVDDAPTFQMGVQWHPEWRFWDIPMSRVLFDAFGDAVRDRAALRAAGSSVADSAREASVGGASVERVA